MTGGWIIMGTKPIGPLCSAEAQADSPVTSEPNQVPSANFHPKPWIPCLRVLMANCPHWQRSYYCHLRHAMQISGCNMGTSALGCVKTVENTWHISWCDLSGLVPFQWCHESTVLWCCDFVLLWVHDSLILWVCDSVVQVIHDFEIPRFWKLWSLCFAAINE